MIQICMQYPTVTAGSSVYPTTYPHLPTTATKVATVTALTGQTTQPQAPAQSSPGTNAGELSVEAKAGIAGGAIGSAFIIVGLVWALVWQRKRAERQTRQQNQNQRGGHVPLIAQKGGMQELGGRSVAGLSPSVPHVAAPPSVVSLETAKFHPQNTSDLSRGWYGWNHVSGGAPPVELGGPGAFIHRPELGT